VNALKKLYLITITMLNLLITILIVMIVGYMAYAESKYLFGQPTGCNKNVKIKSLPATIASAK